MNKIDFLWDYRKWPKNQHGGEVDSDSRFKVKGFEVIGDVSNNIKNVNSSENTE